MSTTVDRTNELFLAATLGDDDPGYPDEVSFVPADKDWADDVVRRNLERGMSTVLVTEDLELLLLPRPRTRVDQLRRSVRVRVTYRVHGHSAPFATWSRLGRHPVREMRKLVLA